MLRGLAVGPNRRRRLLPATFLAFAFLALGAAAHLKHHLDDPQCDGGTIPTSHPCVSCLALHGAALPAQELVATPVQPFAHTERPTLEIAVLTTAPPRDFAPRAPPIA
jgi:hypothetical protein